MISSFRNRFIVQATAAYALVAAAWIFASDQLLAGFADMDALVRFSTIKGLVFVIVTAAVLYVALHSVPPRSAVPADDPDPDPRLWSQRLMVYAFAAVVALAMLVLSSNMGSAFTERPMLILFMFPVILGAMLGGTGPGLLATAILAIAAAYLLLPPLHDFHVAGMADTVQLANLVVNGILVSLLSGYLHQARRREAAQRRRQEAMQQDLRRSEERYRRIATTVPVVLYDYVTHPDGRSEFLYVGPHCKDLLEVDEQALLARADVFWDMVHAVDGAGLRARQEQAARAGEDLAEEFRITTPSGREKWIHMASRSDAQGADRSAVRSGIMLEITERKRADALLAASEQKLRLFVEHAPAAIAMLDRELRYVAASRRWIEDLRLPRNDIAGCRHFELAPELAGVWRARFERGLAGATAKSEEELRHHADGSSDWIRWEIRPWHDDGGALGGILVVCESITEQVTARHALHKLSMAVEQANNTVIITDTQGAIEYVNEAFTRGTGYAPADAQGRNVRFLQSGLTPAAVCDALWLSLRAGHSWQGELSNRRRDGEIYPAWCSFTPIRQPDGSITHIVAIEEDITEKKRIARELDEHRHHLQELVARRTAELADAKEAAEAATRAKGAFLATMSHEIRTPLNAVLGMAYQIRRGGVTPRQNDQLDKLDRAAEHLLGIINNILDLSKIEAGKFVLADEIFAPDTVATNVAAMLAERAAAQGLSLQVDNAPLPCQLRGDATRLTQALLNYASNALKFTERGTVTIAVRPQREAGEQVLLHFSVRDTGIGVPAATLPRLFDAFEQADASTTRKYGGSGLGLAITRRIAQMMGGEAGVESVEGQGSTFWFTAMLKKADASALAAPDTAADGLREANLREHAGRRVLLVEDEPFNREVAVELLAEVGLEMDCAENGHEAVAAVQRGAYDLILMDMRMPGMDGLAATRAIRALPAGVAVPIVAMTANAFAEDKAQCMQAGMDDFLTKPVDPRHFYKVLHHWLTQGRQVPAGRNAAT
ncbi:MAG: PAS domain S-box protein [Rhodocyclaceae bacterium]|nr:PAS domain S-box protein [Rhodocyclaceae bacterium]